MIVDSQFSQFEKQIELLLFREFGEITPREDIIKRYVAVENGNLLGTVSVSKRDLSMGKYNNIGPWLADLFVIPEHRNKGIARELIQFVLKQHPSNLLLWTDNHKLVPFYESFGFCLLELVKYKQKIISVMYK